MCMFRFLYVYVWKEMRVYVGESMCGKKKKGDRWTGKAQSTVSNYWQKCEYEDALRTDNLTLLAM